jgi:protoporphyrinogen oxidase
MSNQFKHWGIVGGGLLGMQIANRLAEGGQRVTLLEAGPTLGGLAAGWQLGPVTWDKFYHVILLSDGKLRALLDEIGLGQSLKWVETRTGFYTGGALYSMSNTLEFLRFPPLSLIDKLRLGGTIFYASRMKNWQRLEGIQVTDWLRKLSGRNTFDKIWLPLLRAKLGDSYQDTSAAFIWATIQRMYAARRTGLKKEMFGYVPGGYARILDVLREHLRRKGVRFNMNFEVGRIDALDEGGVTVESKQGETLAFDEVIVTVPSAIASEICPGISAAESEQHRRIRYLGVICASVLLEKSISPFYITNITDRTPFTGIIEMTNIVAPSHFGGRSLVYLPRYLSKDDPMFRWSNEKIEAYFRKHLLAMYSHISDEDMISIQVARAPYVFALSTIGYSRQLPPVSTSVPGLHILNTAHIVNGTLNVNETLQLVDRELPGILSKANRHNIIQQHR